MDSQHPLDNPIWSALSTHHAALAYGDNRARRYSPEIGPLSGVPVWTDANVNALAEFTKPGDVVVLFPEERHDAPPGWQLVREGPLAQMVQETAPQPALSTKSSKIVRLYERDASAMLELATLTEPGPFRTGTHRLGCFWGIVEDGRLLAMAGQRLQTPQYVEVSAVCTHPDARGRGYATALIATVCEEIRRRGKTPFLHSWADNHSAIRVYQSLGFALRRRLHVTALQLVARV
jgi:ribosomal protein S18 acetylase RimI-like enzyme